MMTSRQLVAAKQALEALQSHDAQPVGPTYRVPWHDPSLEDT